MKTYKNRNDVPLNEKWNLEDIYSSLEKWEEDYQRIEQLADKLKTFDGQIQDGYSLYQYLEQKEKLSYIFNKLYAYAMLKTDEDTRVSDSQAFVDRAKQLGVKISSSTSFLCLFF